MVNKEILFRENQSVMLTMLHKDLYRITDDKSVIMFHDHNCHKLFFIYLHDYISAKFKDPTIQKSDISLFDLTLKFCGKYQKNEYFKKIIKTGNTLKKFLSKEKTYYKIYIPPHTIDLKTSLLELINFAGNEAKHSYFRLSQLKQKMHKFFEANHISICEDKEYYDHLEYFMENVVEDKLNYHQTKIVELLGNYFLAINVMLNSKYCSRVRKIRNDAIKKHKLGEPLDIKKPNDLLNIEEFYWKIMWVGGVENKRLTELIPKTSPYLQRRE